MDGSDRRAIVQDGLYWPNALAIDYSAGRFYWADAKLHLIESAHFDGLDRRRVTFFPTSCKSQSIAENVHSFEIVCVSLSFRQILNRHLPHPFAITVFEDQLYWTDWTTKSISAANKITGKGYRNVHSELHFPMDIHSYHASRQPSFLNRCALDRGLRGGCSHLCLPNKMGRRCGCPIGLVLKDDQ